MSNKKSTKQLSIKKSLMALLFIGVVGTGIYGFAVLVPGGSLENFNTYSLTAAVHNAAKKLEKEEAKKAKKDAGLGIASTTASSTIVSGVLPVEASSSTSASSTTNPSTTVSSSNTSGFASTTNSNGVAPTTTLSTSSSSSTTPDKVKKVPPPTNLQGNDYGISIGDTFLALSPTQINAELSDMSSLGVGWVRIDFDWSVIQPATSTSYNWAPYDAFISDAKAHNIKVLGIVDYTPIWARANGCNSEQCPPASYPQFASYAGVVVSRYAPLGVNDWEVWNEPNNAGFWVPAANTAQYVQLLEETYISIKKADPSAFVISGGLAPEVTNGHDIAPVDFLSQMYADGAEPYFNAVGWHPYAFPGLPSGTQSWNTWYQMFGTNPSARSVMIANGDTNKPIWITEIGAPTNGPSGSGYVSESVQSTIISQAVNLVATYTWAGPLFIYSYKDLGTNPDTVENFFGLLRYNGSEKPAYTELKELLST